MHSYTKPTSLELSKAKTLEELYQLAKRYNYKPGWAEYVHKSREKFNKK